jgi:hypothetical protein
LERLVGESGKSLGAWPDSDGRMIRGGFLSEEDRKAPIALGARWFGGWSRDAARHCAA